MKVADATALAQDILTAGRRKAHLAGQWTEALGTMNCLIEALAACLLAKMGEQVDKEQVEALLTLSTSIQSEIGGLGRRIKSLGEQVQEADLNYHDMTLRLEEARSTERSA